jgi:hypothetical protein
MMFRACGTDGGLLCQRVAQIFNLPYRRFSIGKAPATSNALETRHYNCRTQFLDAAERGKPQPK